MVGTFDVANFGDLLFPLLAEQALSERLGKVDLRLFSYRETHAPQWHDVRPLGALREELPGCDLLLVGGGHLVRFDPHVAPGYLPTDDTTHNPTGLWLGPSLAALAAGVPVAWNAVGVFGPIPPWAVKVVREVLLDVDLVAVRGEHDARQLLTASPSAQVRVVPDTGFAAPALLQPPPDGGGYMLVQASPFLRDSIEQVRALADEARGRGLEVREVAISPGLDDEPGVLDLPGHVQRVEPWPGPRELLELIAGAEAVVAWSLHMSMTSAAFGVPVHRPATDRGEKHALVEGLEQVHTWGEGEPVQLTTREGGPAQDARALADRVGEHWDAVAALARAGRQRAVPRYAAVIGEALGDAGETFRECERLRTERDNLMVWVREEQERLRALKARRSVSMALRAADTAGRARQRLRRRH
jgi:hypothetical protein